MLSTIQLAATLFQQAQGYRTYAAGLAAFLVQLGATLGLIPVDQATHLSMACVGLAVVFQRLASADHQLTLVNMQKDLADAVAAIETLTGPTPPTPPALQLFDPTKIAATSDRFRFPVAPAGPASVSPGAEAPDPRAA